MASKSQIDLNSECVNYTNVKQNVIHITEDKLKVILLEYREKHRQVYSWTTPLGIFLSCLLATITANFEHTWGLSAAVWQAIFIICTVGTGIWFASAGYRAFKNRKGREIKDLIETIKNDSKPKE